jgi:nucleotide-binding universal stress UspA family protein
MGFFRRATVALADDPVDDGLVRYATGIAERAASSMELRFVHVAPTPDAADARSRLAAQCEIAPCEMLRGPRIDKLLEFAAKSGSDCIFAGERPSAGNRRRLTRRLAMHAPCSLWLVPETSPRAPARVLAAVDFSVASAFALHIATLLANRLALPECTALHVYGADVSAPDEAAFKNFLGPLDLHGVRVVPAAEQAGSVAAAVARTAARQAADLIVMGARGLSSSSAVLLGAESEQLLTETDRPVLITKPPGDRLELVELLLRS